MVVFPAKHWKDFRNICLVIVLAPLFASFRCNTNASPAVIYNMKEGIKVIWEIISTFKWSLRKIVALSIWTAKFLSEANSKKNPHLQNSFHNV